MEGLKLTSNAVYTWKIENLKLYFHNCRNNLESVALVEDKFLHKQKFVKCSINVYFETPDINWSFS